MIYDGEYERILSKNQIAPGDIIFWTHEGEFTRSYAPGFKHFGKVTKKTLSQCDDQRIYAIFSFADNETFSLESAERVSIDESRGGSHCLISQERFPLYIYRKLIKPYSPEQSGDDADLDI